MQKKTAEIENRIKEPVTDRENDIFYDELNEIEKEFNRLSEINYYKTHQIEEAREKTEEILQRIFSWQGRSNQGGNIYC